jgi:hypothetical protein
MGLQDLVSESEAAAYAGVSSATLNRFAEAGYLRIESDAEGLRLYSMSELSSVFGLGAISGTRGSVSTKTSSSPKPPLEPGNGVTTLSQALQFEPSPALFDPPIDGDGAQTAPALERELSKLKSVTQLQEKLLDMKEAELRDLQEQRSWLKTRLERLEEKAERDQLLLLSETQTIRKLINIEEQRKSPLRLALEWLGFAPAQQAGRDTIEIRQQTAAQPPGETPNTAG